MSFDESIPVTGSGSYSFCKAFHDAFFGKIQDFIIDLSRDKWEIKNITTLWTPRSKKNFIFFSNTRFTL